MQKFFPNINSNPDLEFANYIKPTKNATVRLDIETSPESILGLTADCLPDGLILIIQSTDGRRLSLTHADVSFDFQAISKESFWVRPAAKLTIVLGLDFADTQGCAYSHFKSTILPSLENFRLTVGFPLELDASTHKPASSVAISRKGLVSCFPETKGIGHYAPCAELRDCTNLLSNVNMSRHHIDLQYDGIDWTTFPSEKKIQSHFLRDGNYAVQYKITYENFKIKKVSAMKALKCGKFNDSITELIYCLAWLQHTESVLNENTIITLYNLGSAYLSNNNYPLAYNYLRLAYANRVAVDGLKDTRSEKYKNKLTAALNILVPFNPFQSSDEKFSLPESSFYIECDQDGICRLDLEKSPKQILGLFTQGVQTCMPLLIVGKNRISLIHDTGKLRVLDVVEEGKWVGEIEYWTIAYNPYFAPEGLKDLGIKEKLSRYILNAEFGDVVNMKLFRKNTNGLWPVSMPFGRLSILRNKEINDSYPANFRAAPSTFRAYRYRLNILHNVLAPTEGVPADLQFDGYTFSPPKSLPYSLEEIEKKIKSTSAYSVNDWDMFKQLFLPEHSLQEKLIQNSYQVSLLSRFQDEAENEGSLRHK